MFMPHSARISYILCTTQRSGSTYLCDLIAHTDVLGRPREYFVEDWLKRIASRPYLELPQGEEVGFVQYLERVIEKTTSPNGVFGLKILQPHLLDMLRRLREYDAYRTMEDADILARVFPGVRFVWLTRRDKVRQAISLLNARQSGVWNSSQLPPGEGHAAAVLDNAGIDGAMRTLIEHEARWQEFFAALRIEPLTLVYEDFVRDPLPAVQRLAAYVGVPLPFGWRAESAETKAPITVPEVDATRAAYLAYSRDLMLHRQASPDVAPLSIKPEVPMERPIHIEYLWLCIGQDSIEQSEAGPDNAWLERTGVAIVCLHWRERPYFDSSVIDEVRQSLGGAFFYFFIPRLPPPEHSFRHDPPVDSFACPVEVFKALYPRSGIAGSPAFAMASALLEDRGELPSVRCLQLPLASGAYAGAKAERLSLEWIVPHQGDLGYLRRCLESVAATAHSGDKVSICFDEEVTGEHEDVMSAFPSFRYFMSQPFGNGPYVARDRLGKNSEADIVMFQDSDDISCCDRRSVLMKAMQEQNLELIGSHELRVDEMAKIVFPVRFPQFLKLGALAMGHRHPLFHPTSAIRRDALVRAGGFSTNRKFANDVEFLYRAAFVLRGGSVDEFLYIRRKRENSLSTAPATANGSEYRRQLRQEWIRDINRVLRREIRYDQASYRTQHRPDYGSIALTRIKRSDP